MFKIIPSLWDIPKYYFQVGNAHEDLCFPLNGSFKDLGTKRKMVFSFEKGGG